MKLKILNNTYEVKEVECIEHGSSNVGLIKNITQEIFLMKSLLPEQKLQTLLHETLHSIFLQLGYSKEYEDEQLIDSISTALSLFLRENKKDIDYLIKNIIEGGYKI